MKNNLKIISILFLISFFTDLSCSSNKITSDNNEIIKKSENITSFCYNDFSFYHSIENANYIIHKKYNSDIKRIDNKYFETDYIQVDNYRKKYVFGINDNLNLIVEYFLLNNKYDYDRIYRIFLNNISANNNFIKKKSNDDYIWINGDQTIRCFSCNVQMDGQEGYTFWIMYSKNIDWSAYDYIYEPFRLHREPVIFDDIDVHWGFDQQIDNFRKKYPKTFPINNDSERLREIIINEKNNIIYVDYIFNKDKLTSISINYEMQSSEERDNLFYLLKKKYTKEYGKGFWDSTYDTSIYNGYVYSDSELFCDAMITLHYNKDHYVKDQIDENNHRVSILFMKY